MEAAEHQVAEAFETKCEDSGSPLWGVRCTCGNRFWSRYGADRALACWEAHKRYVEQVEQKGAVGR